MEILLILLVVGGLIALVLTRGRGRGTTAGHQLGDAEAEARRWYDRLGGQVLNLTGSDDPSKQALADASERYNAAGSQLEQATTAQQYRLAGDTALEGLYYVRAARTAMGMDPGPDLPGTAERSRAGALDSEQSVDVGGRQVTGSPQPSSRNDHYYPGGMVGGRPVPAGWYSEPWWKPMLLGGVGAVGGIMLADALFSGFGGAAVGGDVMAGGFDGGMDPGMDPGLDPGFDGGFDGGGFDFGDW
ncbi:hypothetical protein GCM10023200_45610 [Actinomycetospora chlora]|uniref:DUF1542 domain-containing protein n=1 Tax=Actinomycetospora chlora TaxID=663608 RepID=A0ABP9C1J8_9PSEU